MHQKIICFVGGKSGGHIVPCLTLAQRYKDNTILFFSTDATLDKTILRNNPLITKHIALPLGIMRITRLYHYPRVAWHIFRSFCTAFYQLYNHNPNKVISTGGLIGVPVCLAAKLLRIPIELYELNVIPGKAAQLIAALAHTIYVCFEQTQYYFSHKQCIVTEYPVRFSNKVSKQTAQQKLGLDPNKKTIFILGGSQGSLFLNNAIKNFIEQTPMNSIQVIHQIGVHDQTNWQQLYKNHQTSAYVFTYTNAIDHCYAAADLILSRAGAGTLFEIKFFGKKSIIIPLEIQYNNHQYKNACAIAEQYPALFTVMRQHDIEVDRVRFFETIIDILQENHFILQHAQDEQLKI